MNRMKDSFHFPRYKYRVHTLYICGSGGLSAYAIIPCMYKLYMYTKWPTVRRVGHFSSTLFAEPFALISFASVFAEQCSLNSTIYVNKARWLHGRQSHYILHYHVHHNHPASVVCAFVLYLYYVISAYRRVPWPSASGGDGIHIQATDTHRA